jgi:hypothetical protein
MSSVDIRYSKDGGHNWSDWRKMDMGQTGEFMKRISMRRFGIGRQWVFDIRVTDPVRADMITASAMLEGVES